VTHLSQVQPIQAVCYKCERWPGHLNIRVHAWPDCIRSWRGCRANSRPYHTSSCKACPRAQASQVRSRVNRWKFNELDGRRDGRFTRRVRRRLMCPAQRFLQFMRRGGHVDEQHMQGECRRSFEVNLPRHFSLFSGKVSPVKL
jgi:hypothetical protein